MLEAQLGEWKAVSRPAGIGWLCFYALFLLYAASNRGGFLVIDFVNLMIHEAGHMFFGWFGYTLTILGGTLGELIVPLVCAVYFGCKREAQGFAFCGFWFFENFLYIGTYMADARAEALPLVGSGDHDWNILFSQWGWILQDRKIGAFTTAVGWIGMLAVTAWLAWRVEWRARSAGE